MRSPGRDCKGRKTNGPNTEPYSMPTLPSVKEKIPAREPRKEMQERKRITGCVWCLGIKMKMELKAERMRLIQ